VCRISDISSIYNICDDLEKISRGYDLPKNIGTARDSMLGNEFSQVNSPYVLSKSSLRGLSDFRRAYLPLSEPHTSAFRVLLVGATGGVVMQRIRLM